MEAVSARFPRKSRHSCNHLRITQHEHDGTHDSCSRPGWRHHSEEEVQLAAESMSNCTEVKRKNPTPALTDGSHVRCISKKIHTLSCGRHEFRAHLHHEVVDALVADLRGGGHGGSPTPQRQANEGRFPHHTFCCAYQPLPEHRRRACCERGSSCSCAQTATENGGCGDLAVWGGCSARSWALWGEGSSRDAEQECGTRAGRRQQCHDHKLLLYPDAICLLPVASTMAPVPEVRVKRPRGGSPSRSSAPPQP